MNTFARFGKLFAFLLVVLVACAPALPARNQSVQMNTTEQVMESNATESNETMTNESLTAMVTEPMGNESTEPQTGMLDVPSDLPRKEVVEGETVSFPNLKAVDPDGDPITYTFSAPLSEKGIWKTKEGDAGEQIVTITASDGTNTVEQRVMIVVHPKNQPPQIELDEPIQVNEGDEVTLNPTVSDPDGDNVTLTYSGWMTGPAKNTSFDDSGLHKVVITASDGTTVVNKEVIVSVNNSDRAPTLFALDQIEVKEGQRVIVKPAAKDPDGDTITFTYEEPINTSGIWATQVGDAGEYEFKIIGSDGELSAETTVKVVVDAVNKAPTIELASPIDAKEGDVVTLSPTVTDPEGDDVRVSYSGWMDSERRQTTYDDSGNHKVTITARDSAGNEAKLEVIVIVADQNRPPVFGQGSFN